MRLEDLDRYKHRHRDLQPDGVRYMGRDGYKDGQTATESVVVDDVKQYKISLSYFSATLKVTSDSGATVTATNGTKTFSGTVPTSGVLSLTITASGTYTVTATKSGETTDPVSVAITTSGQTYSVECLVLRQRAL